MKKVPAIAKSSDLTCLDDVQCLSLKLQLHMSGRVGCACFSHDQEQGGSLTEVKAALQGMSGSHHWSWEAYTRNSQTSEVIGGECWELKALQGQPDIGNNIANI